MCVTPCVSRIGSWMKRNNTNEPQDIVEMPLNAVKILPCFSLQQSRDLKTDLVISPGNETMMLSGSTNKCFSQLMDGFLKIKTFLLLSSSLTC